MLKQIEMIAYFDLKENARPIRFRVESEDGSLETVGIDNILDIKKSFRFVEYICECIVQGYKRVVNISYNCEEFKWYVKL